MPPQTGQTCSSTSNVVTHRRNNEVDGAMNNEDGDDYCIDNGLLQYRPNKIRHMDDFLHDMDWDEPHERRRRMIMEKYGNKIRPLFGVEHWTKWQCLIVVGLQLTMCYLLKDTTNYWLFFAMMYCVGGTLNQMCSLGIHEVSHFLAFEKELHNRLLAIFVNLPLCVPAAAAFRVYHMEHHQYQGVAGVDTDIATYFEARRIKGKFLKLLNLIFMSAFYGLRPMIVRPKAVTGWIAINFVVQMTFNFAIFYFWGLQALMYLLLSSFFGLGLHPCSGHFIQEHFVFDDSGQETYSYYGPLNKVMWNVGYHVEHHDFPRIPFTRLPLLRKIAPEFYENQKHYTSLIKVLWDYVMDDGFGAFNRVSRTMQTHELGKSKTREMNKLRKQRQQQQQQQQKE